MPYLRKKELKKKKKKERSAVLKSSVSNIWFFPDYLLVGGSLQVMDPVNLLEGENLILLHLFLLKIFVSLFVIFKVLILNMYYS